MERDVRVAGESPFSQTLNQMTTRHGDPACGSVYSTSARGRHIVKEAMARRSCPEGSPDGRHPGHGGPPSGDAL